MEERIGWRGQNGSQIIGEEKRNGRLNGAAETSKERAEWRRLQRKNWNILGLPKRKEWPQCHRESSWQQRRSRLCQKQKKQSRQSRASNHERERVKVGESRTLAREREHQSESMEKKRVNSTVKEGRLQKGKGGHARRASLEQVQGSISA